MLLKELSAAMARMVDADGTHTCYGILLQRNTSMWLAAIENQCHCTNLHSQLRSDATRQALIHMNCYLQLLHSNTAEELFAK